MTAQARIDKGLYWDRAWSLVEGCTPVSEGCRHCWAAEQAWRRRRHPIAKISAANQGVAECPVPRQNVRDKSFATPPRFKGVVRVRDDLLTLPIRTQKPTVWSVWTDLFHESVSEEFIIKAFSVMRECPRHIFLILTKRAEFMHQRLALEWPAAMSKDLLAENIWLGVTVEEQRHRKRFLHLFETPALRRFVSCEPLLSSLDMEVSGGPGPGDDFYNVLTGQGSSVNWTSVVTSAGPKLDWVIAGPETGHFARPCPPAWLASLKRQCDEAGVPFFDKSKKPISRDLPWAVRK